MKYVIFLAVCIAAVAAFPWEYWPQWGNDKELDHLNWKITLRVKNKDGVWRRVWSSGDKNKKTENKDKNENKDKQTEIAGLSERDVTKLKLPKIKVKGDIKVNIKFSDLEEAYSQDETRLWIHTEGKDVHVGGSVQLKAEEVEKIVQKELTKLGIKDEINKIQIIEPVKLENIELLTSSDLENQDLATLSPEEFAKKVKVKTDIKIRVKVGSSVALEGVENVDVAGAETAKFKVKWKGDIKVNIKFLNPNAMETAVAEEEKIPVCVTSERGGFYSSAIVNVEGMSTEIDDIEMVPAELETTPAGVEIHIDGKIKW